MTGRAARARTGLPRTADARHLLFGEADKALARKVPTGRLGLGFIKPFWRLAGGFWTARSQVRPKLALALLLALTLSQVGISLLTNAWNKNLFDAIEQKSMAKFFELSLVVLGLLLLNLAVTNSHLFVKRWLQIGWREWLTGRLLDKWIDRSRQHNLSFVPGEHDNPDQRIADSAAAATDAAVEMSLSLFFCALTLAGYTQVLWTLSGALDLTIGGADVSVDGWLIYPTVLYAAAATAVAMLIGKPMTRAANLRSSCEADFRYALAGVREHGLPIAVQRGEEDERRRLKTLFSERVRHGFHRQTAAISLIMSFGMSYGTISMIFPFLISAPAYIAGTITLGVLMQTTQAIGQLAGALSWPANNVGGVADWRTSCERILNLCAALDELQDVEAGGKGLVVGDDESGCALVFEKTCLKEPGGKVLVEPFDLVVGQGETISVTGDPDAATRIFRAAAGAWPWGSGRIHLPACARIHFVEQTTYLPRGTVRGALSYPKDSSGVSMEAARGALKRVGLERFAGILDDSDTSWRKTLTTAERQRFGFARLLAQRPAWIFVEDLSSVLDVGGEIDLGALLAEEFKDATLIAVDCHGSGGHLPGSRVVVLERAGATEDREEAKAAKPAAESKPGAEGAGAERRRGDRRKTRGMVLREIPPSA